MQARLNATLSIVSIREKPKTDEFMRVDRKDENEGINIFFALLRIGLALFFMYNFFLFMLLD